jgi:hypothetical protein
MMTYRAQLARLRALTKLEITSLGNLPETFLGRPVRNPREIVNSLPLRHRTSNTLRRHMAKAKIDGAWTYGRLLRVPGLGIQTLLDVLSAEQEQAPGGLPGSSEVTTTLHAVANRAMVAWGILSVPLVASQANITDTKFAARVLSAHREFQWLDQKNGWFWFSRPRGRVVIAVEQALFLGRPVPLSELAQTLFRRWPREAIPSLAAFRAVCEQIKGVRVSGKLVRITRIPRMRPLSPVELQIVAVFKEWGPCIRGTQLSEVARSLGLDVADLRTFLLSSIWVIEKEPEVFRLIGS